MAMSLGDLAYWLDAVTARGEQMREQHERAQARADGG
jgi:hypothetical protein